MNAPEDQGTMFFAGIKFSPDETMTQDQLFNITTFLMSQIFMTADGNHMPIKHEGDPMVSLVQMLVDLDVRMNTDVFDLIPNNLRRFFKVVTRDGKEHRCRPNTGSS